PSTAREGVGRAAAVDPASATSELVSAASQADAVWTPQPRHLTWRRSPLTAGRERTAGGGRAGSLGRALDLVGELAKGADCASRHLTAALALPARHGIGPRERRPALPAEADGA